MTATPFVRNPETGVMEYAVMIPYMKSVLRRLSIEEESHSIFQDKRLEFINKSIRNGNFYGIDKYGLIIRANEKGKGAFGWKYDDNGDPVNVNINGTLLKLGDVDIIRRSTLQNMKKNGRFTKLFAKKEGAQHVGMIRRIYTEVFPDYDLDAF